MKMSRKVFSFKFLSNLSPVESLDDFFSRESFSALNNAGRLD